MTAQLAKLGIDFAVAMTHFFSVDRLPANIMRYGWKQ